MPTKESQKPKTETPEEILPILRPRKHGFIFRLCASIMRHKTRKTTFTFAEEVVPGSCIIGNHCQLWGPVTYQLYYPRDKRIWCTGHVLQKEGSREYALKEFWGDKPKWTQPFWRFIARAFVPHLVVPLLQSADTLGVFHDIRLRNTFNDACACLEHGVDNIIFPESHNEGNGIVMQFHPNFVDIARLYKRRTGKDLLFYPAYLAPTLQKVLVGHPVKYDASRPPEEERVRVQDEITKEITRLALSLPRHQVCPYLNLPKKEWHYSKEKES